jgi:hypothetical protein
VFGFVDAERGPVDGVSFGQTPFEGTVGFVDLGHVFGVEFELFAQSACAFAFVIGSGRMRAT